MAASFCRRSFLNYKNCLFQTQKRTGYVVLIPETPEEVSKFNIDSLENLPDFSNLTGTTCNLITNSLVQKYQVGSWELRQFLPSQKNQDIFKYYLDPLEILSVPLGSAWGVTKILHFSDYKKLSHDKFYNLNEQMIATFSDKFDSVDLYEICKKKLEDKSNNFTEEQNRIIRKYIWEGCVNGFELAQSDKEKLPNILAQLENNRQLYDQKLKVAKSLFKQVIYDKKFGEECPDDLLRLTSADWKSPKEGPWIITLNNHVYNRYLEYCPSRESRMHLWASYNQLCSHRGDPRCKASNEFEKIRTFRRQHAQLLGFPSYAHMAMKNKMAESVEKVQSVLDNLLENAKHAHEKELFELEKFAYTNDSRHTLEAWDFSYWKRLHLIQEKGLDELVLKNYFPLSQVLLGIITLCEHLFGIEITEQEDVEGWNPDVRYFRISDGKTKNLIGGFYLDPYWTQHRAVGEIIGGWFVPLRSKSTIYNSLPLSALIFNFSPPEENLPSLLYPREVENLFEKFGQMLQHTLTEMNYSDVSGMSNIEWDAVGVSKHFLKYWLCERGTLESISGHYETGESLPATVLDNLCHLKRHMAGTQLCRHIYLCNLDLSLHLENDSWRTIVEKLWPKHMLFHLSDLDHHACGLQDIISGVWGGSFYGELWSSMLAADVFSAFEEAGFQNQEEMKNLGRRFRSTFLALGGGCDPKEVFRRFRGRDPNHKFLTKHLNLRDPVPLPSREPEPETEPVLA